ncbi:2,3-bisphosphoglycerate-independent phosphoglycerate mutase [Spongiibacter sp. KMU-158]|uniref:2,3-bisphosphoglycerate-independent phosphoglycerate mutase n=1 Tax=Spongiibacter pelagi TaxID=2760804 RepID=A0A927GWZ0_9GAMM|nr:2,3-bisphosphoglycerate-independent phosphoglycerate mutase [Spongiibacter pelagi]MBD2859970.1 2,3-bisphosphoglycerate-independent phosphoglycerate mutase [Spongiibacter pelagi]
MTTPAPKKPVVLIILDGFGYREAPEDNAIYHANTPYLDQLWQSVPHTLISGSGLDVGLPDGQMGNSEVGHMSLGSGRIVYQSITRIDKAIADGDFFNNPAYTESVDKAIENGKAIHIMGLLSPGGVHSHEQHLFAMMELAAKRGANKIYLHAFLDGRDTPPRSAQSSLERADAKFAELGVGRTASVVGRYFAMDRDQRWDRVEKAYRLLTESKAEYRYDSSVDALNAAYARDENDEFVAPSIIQTATQEDARIADGDAVIFMNFRADRARELSYAFIDKNFDGFERGPMLNLGGYVMTSQYADDLDGPVAFPPDNIANSFGEVLESAGRTQLRIAETEKYAHVTFFFSGGREALYQGEDRKLIKSPDVATYDLKPEMSAPEVTEELVAAIKSGNYDAIICNYANGDMVGHTGVFEAAVKAVEALDSALEKVCAAVREVGGQCLITADHGNCEQMQDYDALQPHTQHTTELVPLFYVGDKPLQLDPKGGRLCDIAPTLLGLLNIEQPAEMTGHNLLLPR